MTDASPSPIKMAPIKMAPIKMAARDVSVFYGAKQALNQVSIDVDMDNVTAFIGPSGCGKSTFLRTLNRMNDTIRSEEHTSELQSLMRISYAVFCLKKKNKYTNTRTKHITNNTNEHT